ncbi:MAG: DUF1129 domain-containing protein [Streptococcaceae bacterium]|jgi:uncharacterized membrane-anchored protein|nr:DUF1129 domain-containing protein [Streptococcaceae bacterium]
MESADLQKLNEENKSLQEKLTGKNADYFFSLKKALNELEVPETVQVERLNEMLKAAVESQKNGVTAKTLFGTVAKATEEWQASSEKKTSALPDNDAPGWMWLDSSLLLLGLLAFVAGLMGAFQKDHLATYGILSLFVMGIVGGGVFLLMYRLIYRFERPGADQSEKPGLLKMIGILVVGMFIWMLLYALTMAVPGLNPRINAYVVLAIAIVAFGAKYYLKKRFNIVSAMQPRR